MVSKSASSSPSHRLRNHQKTATPMTTLERRLETCRNIYRLLRTEFPDLPRYKKTNFVVHSAKTCTSAMSHGILAHTHPHPDDPESGKICFNKRALLELPLVTPVNPKKCCIFYCGFCEINFGRAIAAYRIPASSNNFYKQALVRKGKCPNCRRYLPKFIGGCAPPIYNNCTAELVAHESAHLMVPGCRHCRKFWERMRKHEVFLRKCELDGRLQKCVVY